MESPTSPRTVFRWAAAASLGVISVLAVAGALYAVRTILIRAFVALFIAVSLDPAVRWLVRHRVKRPYAVALIFLAALLAAAGLITAVGPPLVHQVDNISRDLPGYLSQLSERSKTFRQFAERYGVMDQITQWARTVPQWIANGALDFFRQFLSALFAALTVLVLTIYFMADLQRLREGVVRLFPGPRRRSVRRTVDIVVDKVGAYMIGNLAISLVAGVSAFVCLAALRVPFALPLAVVVAITDLIPMIGATLGAAIGVAFTFITVGLWPATVIVALFFLVYQQVENYWIAPRILRNAVDLPAVAVLLAGLIGATVLGLVGALIAIPVAAVVKVLGSPVIRAMDEDEPDGRHTVEEKPALVPEE